MKDAHFTPFLAGKAQFKSSNDPQCKLLIAEFLISSIDDPPSVMLTATKKLSMSNEHKDQGADEEANNNFLPELLATTNWLNGTPCSTLNRIQEIRRNSGAYLLIFICSRLLYLCQLLLVSLVC